MRSESSQLLSSPWIAVCRLAAFAFKNNRFLWLIFMKMSPFIGSGMGWPSKGRYIMYTSFISIPLAFLLNIVAVSSPTISNPHTLVHNIIDGIFLYPSDVIDRLNNTSSEVGGGIKYTLLPTTRVPLVEEDGLRGWVGFMMEGGEIIN